MINTLEADGGISASVNHEIESKRLRGLYIYIHVYRGRNKE